MMNALRLGNLAAFAVIVMSSLGLWGCGGGGGSAQTQFPYSVAKATCSPGDNPETGLQGQSTLAERMGGSSAKGIQCNLNLVGQFQGEGAYHAQTWIDHCSYFSTANGNAGQQHPGVTVVDVSDPTHPVATAYLNVPSMVQTWESLKISTAAKLLAAVESEGGAGIHPGFAVYDVSTCTSPVLLASVNLPIPPHTIIMGHAGAMAPDGRTYYGSTTATPGSLYVIDIANPAQPNLMTVFMPNNGIGVGHDLSVSKDGNRVYMMQLGQGVAGDNGLTILDVSDFNARKANPQIRVVGSTYWTDAGVGMTSEQIAINGKPYLLVSDELQVGYTAGTRSSNCANGTPLFGFGRLVDISDETHPFTVSEMKLEVDNPNNCAVLANDLGFLNSGFGYSAHYCTADNRENTQLVACSRHEAGIRVFDVRDPTNPKEVAYYKPPIHTNSNLPGSGIDAIANHTYDWNKSHSRFINVNGEIELWTTSADNGFQVLKFNTATMDPALFTNVPTSLATITVP
jgi:hypothetical protein